MKLNELPVIVDAPGYYRTRAGMLVHVSEIVPPPVNPECTAFCAKGNYIKEVRGGKRLGAYEIWHVSGRLSVFKEMGGDIVRKET